MIIIPSYQTQVHSDFRSPIVKLFKYRLLLKLCFALYYHKIKQTCTNITKYRISVNKLLYML